MNRQDEIIAEAEKHHNEREDLYDQAVLMLAHAGVSVIVGRPRNISEFGTPYELVTEDYFSRDEARKACLAYFQQRADTYRQVREAARQGDEFEIFEKYREVACAVVFRRSPMIIARREQEPGTGPDFNRPVHYTGKTIQNWNVRCHWISLQRYMEWWHPIMFSHEPGRAHGG